MFSEYAGLRCAPDGSLWIQPFDPETGLLGRAPGWVRFDVDGSRTTIELPSQFQVFSFMDDRIWGTAQD